MPKNINNPTVGRALTRLFNLQGRVQPSLDEIVLPVVQVANIAQEAPPSPKARCAALLTTAATGAGENYDLVLQVPIGVRIELLEFGTLNSSGNDVEWYGQFNGLPGGTLPVADSAEVSCYDRTLAAEGSAPLCSVTGDANAAAMSDPSFAVFLDNLGRPDLSFYRWPDPPTLGGDNAPGYLWLQGQVPNSSWTWIMLQWIEYRLF